MALDVEFVQSAILLGVRGNSSYGPLGRRAKASV